jgi:hypothetical protein
MAEPGGVFTARRVLWDRAAANRDGLIAYLEVSGSRACVRRDRYLDVVSRGGAR